MTDLICFQCCVCGVESDSYRLSVPALKGRDCPAGWLGGSHNDADVCPACLKLLAPLAREAVVKMGELAGSLPAHVYPDDILIRVIRYLNTAQLDAAKSVPLPRPAKSAAPRYRESKVAEPAAEEPAEVQCEETAAKEPPDPHEQDQEPDNATDE